MKVDTHCHIDLYENPLRIIEECEKENITAIAMTNLPSHFEMGYPHVISCKKVRLSLGLHPLYSEKHVEEFPLFIKNISRTSYIGEIGLDFSIEGYKTKEIQINTFKRILQLIGQQKKILSIHSRRAEKEVFNLLQEYKIENAIFHWYTGSLSLIEKISEMGYCFSVNYAMTQSENGKKIINKIPIQNLLTETDGPFVKRDNKIMKPTDINVIINEIAKIKCLSNKDVENAISNNFRILINKIK